MLLRITVTQRFLLSGFIFEMIPTFASCVANNSSEVSIMFSLFPSAIFRYCWAVLFLFGCLLALMIDLLPLLLEFWASESEIQWWDWFSFWFLSTVCCFCLLQLLLGHDNAWFDAENFLIDCTLCKFVCLKMLFKQPISIYDVFTFS